jgi:outer membrane scaffolding protein for murein synthesis (MipA/OmpV family)
LIGRVQWTSLPDAIRDSPIVEDDATLFALVGVMFDL